MCFVGISVSAISLCSVVVCLVVSVVNRIKQIQSIHAYACAHVRVCVRVCVYIYIYLYYYFIVYKWVNV